MARRAAIDLVSFEEVQLALDAHGHDLLDFVAARRALRGDEIAEMSIENPPAQHRAVPITLGARRVNLLLEICQGPPRGDESRLLLFSSASQLPDVVVHVLIPQARRSQRLFILSQFRGDLPGRFALRALDCRRLLQIAARDNDPRILLLELQIDVVLLGLLFHQ